MTDDISNLASELSEMPLSCDDGAAGESSLVNIKVIDRFLTVCALGWVSKAAYTWCQMLVSNCASLLSPGHKRGKELTLVLRRNGWQQSDCGRAAQYLQHSGEPGNLAAAPGLLHGYPAGMRTVHEGNVSGTCTVDEMDGMLTIRRLRKVPLPLSAETGGGGGVKK